MDERRIFYITISIFNNEHFIKAHSLMRIAGKKREKREKNKCRVRARKIFERKVELLSIVLFNLVLFAITSIIYPISVHLLFRFLP